MEATLTTGTQVTPGVASHAHGVAALATRQGSCFSGERPGSLGLFHTACGGGADGAGDFEIFSLTTAIQAVGEGNYGRLGPDSSGATAMPTPRRCSPSPTPATRPTRCPARCRRSSRPRRWATPPRGPREHRSLLDLSVDGDAGVGQLRHDVAGRQPAAWGAAVPGPGRPPGRPPGARRPAERRGPTSGSGPVTAGSRVRLALGPVHHQLALDELALQTVQIGRPPAGTRPASVRLDGRRAHGVEVRDTNRGVEITVPVTGGGCTHSS